MFLHGRQYHLDKRRTPMARAIYYSASARDDDIFGNDITREKPAFISKAITAAFYICGAANGFGCRFCNKSWLRMDRLPGYQLSMAEWSVLV